MALLSFLNKGLIEAGCDEAGRGCIAGPVCAAAVILPQDFFHPLLNDSKKMSERDRYLLRPIIEANALAFGVAFIDAVEIDRINILQASFKAMHLAVDQLTIVPNYLLIDGNRFVCYKNIPHSCVVKGDGKFASIAAASVLAKTYRDDFMMNAHHQFPDFDWKKNKGYPTLFHRKVVERTGLSPLHRKSFAYFSKQAKLPFEGE